MTLCPEWVNRKFALLLLLRSFVGCAIVQIDLAIWTKFCSDNAKNLVIVIFNGTIAFRTSNKNV